MTEQGRSQQVTAVLAATLASCVMIAQQVASRATRDALFLTAYAVRVLPMMVLAGATLSLLSVLFATKMMARFGPARVAPVAFGLNAGLFLLDYLLAHVAAKIGAVVLYLHIALLGATVISIFWSLISERFDPHTCKAFIGRIGTGGTLGGIVGGILAWNASVLLSVRSNLAIMAIMNVLCAVACMRIAARPQVEKVEEKEREAEPTLTVLRGSGYLRLLALLVFLIAINESLLDFVFNSAAAGRYHGGPALIRFFAIFHTATALVTFGLQMGFAKRALARLGPGGTVALLPITVIVGGLFGVASATFVRIIGLRGGEAAISNSLFRSGYELFYTPLASEKKRSTKTAIDVGFDRVGTFIGGGITLVVLAVAVRQPVEYLLAIAIVLGAAVLYLARKLSREYVSALAESLKSETALENAEPSPSQVARISVSAPPSEVARASENAARTLQDIDALLSLEPDRIAPVLARVPLDRRLVAHALPLLAFEELSTPTLRALRPIAPRIVGTVGDALLDPHASVDERRRLPIVLRAAPTQRSCDVLVAALNDPSFEVRYQVGLALAHVTLRAPTLKLDQDRVFAAVLREVEADKATWESRLELPHEEDGDDFEFMDAYLRLKTSRGLQHIFALLSAVLDREPIQLAFRALSTDNDDLRGTALEYLENVLPEDVRDALWPFLGDRRAFRPPRRERSMVVEQLVGREDAIASILDMMRRQHDVPRTSQGATSTSVPQRGSVPPEPRVTGM